jgi:hypothetical protein
MLRGTPGWRRMSPARSRARTIGWTEGGGDAEVPLHLPFRGWPGTKYERNELGALLSGGKQPARKLKRAQILLTTKAIS